MSKLDAQRAMREANYAARQAARPAPTGAGRAAAAQAPVAPPATGRAPSTPAKTRGGKRAASATPDADDGSAEVATCGHTSMNGRSCTREAGHPQKSHRYS